MLCTRNAKIITRSAFFAALSGAFLLAGIAAPQPAAANDLIVSYDQSQLLRLPRNIDQIIIGNPSIADVTVQGGNLLVVTGKTFGITNIIALDAEQNVIQDQRIIVQRDERRIVNLHKGSKRQSFSCAPNCTPTITIGDSDAFLGQILKQAEQKTGFSSGSTEGSAGGIAQ